MVTVPPPLPCSDASEPRYVLNLITGEAWPARCQRNSCAHCLPINARRRALAMTFMEPQRMIRISLCAPSGDPDPLATARIRIKRVRQALLRQGVESGQWSWTLEVNPSGTGYHAHVLQHGSFIPQDALQTACLKAGAGFPYINAIRRSASRTARYGLKAFGAAGYGLKTYRAQETASDALAINHGRLEHHTPRFFNIDGEKCAVRDAEKAAIQAMYPHHIDRYIVCTRRAAEYYSTPEGRRYMPR